jgi:HAD superfamily hydrolase (TIGR01490 family)
MDPRAIKQEIPSLRGLKKEQLELIADRCFEERIKADIFREAEACIRDLTGQGGEVVFATLSVDIIVKPLADYLGVKDAVTSSFEFSGDACTGRFEGGPIFNLEKRDQVLRYIEKSGHSAEDCSFYSDSINDLPLLESVGTPVVVNPDRKLSEVADARGWQICRWR